MRAKPLFAFVGLGLDGRQVATSLEIVDAAGNTVDGPQGLVFFPAACLALTIVLSP